MIGVSDLLERVHALYVGWLGEHARLPAMRLELSPALARESGQSAAASFSLSAGACTSPVRRPTSMERNTSRPNGEDWE